MTEILAFIPARGGSKRLRRKNLRSLGGLSLLERTDRVVREGAAGTPCLLSTDDPEIAETGRSLDWQVPFLRPDHLAADDTPTLPVALHALDWWRDTFAAEPEWLLLMQVTSPFRTSGLISKAVGMIRERPALTAVLGVNAMHRTPGDIHRMDNAGVLSPLGERDGTNMLYTPNGTLYLIRSRILRETGSWAPPGTAPLVTSAIEAMDIDTPEDWRLAEAVVAAGLDPLNPNMTLAAQ